MSDVETAVRAASQTRSETRRRGARRDAEPVRPEGTEDRPTWGNLARERTTQQGGGMTQRTDLLTALPEELIPAAQWALDVATGEIEATASDRLAALALVLARGVDRARIAQSIEAHQRQRGAA